MQNVFCGLLEELWQVKGTTLVMSSGLSWANRLQNNLLTESLHCKHLEKHCSLPKMEGLTKICFQAAISGMKDLVFLELNQYWGL